MKLVKALALSAVLGASASAYAQSCIVADPSDTPLNVRKSAWGKITDKLPDGKDVEVIDFSTDKKGNTWAKIAYWRGNDYREGWVYYRFLSCY